MNNKKVGLLTCFLDNCGACLQAYALQTMIHNLGYDVEIVKYTEPRGYYPANIKNSSYLLDYIRCIYNKRFRSLFLRGAYRASAFNKFRERYLWLSEKEYKIANDLVFETKYCKFVCGSDQIWNPLFYDKCNPVYYLAFAKDSALKIAYAPSIGLNDIPEKYRSKFIEYVNRLDYISVREQRGVELVYSYTNKTAKLVLDPTLLRTGEEWSKMTRRVKAKRPYLFCYLFGDHDYYTEVIERLRKQTGCDVYVIPVSKRDFNLEYRQVIHGGPIEFLSMIKNAEYVLTDSFHATVFSLLFHTPFYTLLRNSDSEIDSMNSRVYSLLKLVGKQDRLLTKEEALSVSAAKIDDFDEVDRKLSELRKDSMNYLADALGGK